jgi:hypothetical protein
MPSRQVHDTIDSELGHRGSKRLLPMTAIDMAVKRTLTARFKAVAMSHAGTFRTSLDVGVESVIGCKADIGEIDAGQFKELKLNRGPRDGVRQSGYLTTRFQSGKRSRAVALIDLWLHHHRMSRLLPVTRIGFEKGVKMMRKLIYFAVVLAFAISFSSFSDAQSKSSDFNKHGKMKRASGNHHCKMKGCSY